ncbi:hypothetical protein [Rhodoblastus sp.]|uniref:hypothetical protein n=1 Tax=Rhodoblastus sp. TaxID=1962975 RepID=UPI003F9CA9EB
MRPQARQSAEAQRLGCDMFIVPSASLIAKAAIEAVGAFDELLTGRQDDDLFCRIFSAGLARSLARRTSRS